jgi:putative peptidoglycan lipid II flippase
VATNIAVGITLFLLIGVRGIAAATSLASWVNVSLMGVTLARRDHYRPSLAATSKLLRALAASVILGGLLALTAWFRPALQGALGFVHLGAIGPKEVLIALVCILGAGLYPVLLFATGGLTPAEVRTALRRKGPMPEGPADLP